MSRDDLTNSTTKIILGGDKAGGKKRNQPAYIVLTVGPQDLVGTQWLIDRKSMTIGRFNTSEIKVAESSLSKAHARITVMDGIISLSDLGATNGTMLNGKKLEAYQTYQLRNNDQIKAGNVVFKFVDPG